MANYLMKSTGAPAIQPTETLGRESIVNVDAMYKFRIHNKANTIAFTGFIPPDFGFELSSNWTSPFGDTSLMGLGQDKLPGAAGAAMGTVQSGLTLGGASSFAKIFSAKKWSGPSYLTLNLPVFLDAYTDTRTEVVENIVSLLSLCAPSEKGGILVPPGPAPINEIAGSAINSVNQATGSDIQNPVDDSESFTVDIGNFFSMSPCVVDSVSANFDNVWEDGTGNPISVDFILNVSSYFAVTREDLKKWLKTQPK